MNITFNVSLHFVNALKHYYNDFEYLNILKKILANKGDKIVKTSVN